MNSSWATASLVELCSIKYSHVLQWLQTGFELVIGYFDQLQIVNTSNYSAIASSHTLHFTTERSTFFQSVVPSPVVVWQQLSTGEVPLPLGSRNIPVSQLPASHNNSSQGLNSSCPLTHSLTNQLLHVTQLNALYSLSCLQHIGTDRTESTVPLLLYPFLLAQTAQKTPLSSQSISAR
jgi:hypothetical protein